MQEKVIRNEKELADALKMRRKELKITQKQLADYANLSFNGISRIELADKSARLSTILKIAKILGYKVILRMDE